MTDAWGRGDVDALMDCCSSEYLLAINDDPESADGVRVLTRESMEALARKSLAGRGVDRRFITDAMWQRPRVDDVVFLQHRAIMLSGPHQGRIDPAIVMARYERGRWRMAFSFPCFARPRALVVEVFPDTQASRLGVRTGDFVERYARQDVADAFDLPKRVRQHAKDPADVPIPMVLSRGGRRIVIDCKPGSLGVRVRTLLQGEIGTLTLANRPAQNHPAAEAIRAMYAAVAAKNADKLAAAVSPAGFLGLHIPEPGAPSVLMHPGNLREVAPADIEALAREVRLDTLRADQFALILRGNLALASWRVTGQTPAGGAITMPVLGCLARHNGQWGLVTMINAGPGAAQIGLHPGQPQQGGGRARPGRAPRGQR
jgi:hypothetical protein